MWFRTVSVGLSVGRSVYLSVCLSVCICLSVCLAGWLAVCLSVCMPVSVCLSLFVRVCVSVFGTAELKRNIYKIPFTWSRVSPSLPPVYRAEVRCVHSPQLYYHDCSGWIPGHTTREPPVGFELETNCFQFCAIANLAKQKICALQITLNVLLWVHPPDLNMESCFLPRLHPCFLVL